MATPPPRGIYVPVPTFFQPKTSATYNAAASPLDVDTQGAHAVYLAKAGIRGLVLLGSTGEAIHLTHDERFEVIAGVRKALDDAGFHGYPLIAGTATQAIADTVDQLRQAKEAGAQWGMVLVPGYFAGASTQDGVVAWFTAVADQSPLPVLVYYYPGVSNNVSVTPATFSKLAQHPNIVGCKLSHGDLSAHTQIAANPAIDHDKFRTFTGLGQQLVPVMAVGGAGAIDGCAAFFPRAVVTLYHLAADEDQGEAVVKRRRMLQYRISCVEELIVRFGTVGIKEAVARLRGFGDPHGTRLPLLGGLPGGDAEWVKWKDALDALDAVESVLG